MVKNEKYKNMYEMYLNGKSLSQVGRAFGVSRQSVYAGFKCRQYEMRITKELSYITYDGLKFTIGNMGYYRCTTGNRELLHRYKYTREVGNIPNNWDVHHMDYNKENNDIDNLVALPKDEHAYLFSTGGNQFDKGNRQSKNMGEREHRINFYIARKQELKSREGIERRIGNIR